MSGRTAGWIAAAAFLVYALTGGGRIVGSDEVAMLELSRAMLHGRIDVAQGATLQGPGGRHYTKNAAGQAVLALPLVAVAEAAGRASGPPPERRVLAVRLIVSFFNAAVTAVLLGVFYGTARGLGIGTRAALEATLLLGFTTPLWVYAKSFMAEPLQALGLLLVLGGAVRSCGGERRGAIQAAIGVLLAVSVKLSMLPLAVLCLFPIPRRPLAFWRWPAFALLVALAGHLAYNAARFGTPFETGYGAQATPSAYTTPLWVGLYGLLLSSGKGVLWFAPALMLAPVGWRAMRRAGGPARHAATSVALASGAALALYATFEHWAGDGSFGPRYLVPLLPLAFLAVALALERVSVVSRRVAWALGLIGLAVQIGGVAIHFGAQMREAGDYPYALPLNDPRFMSDSHFNPRFSPIAGHWRMLGRNVEEHLRGAAPRLGGGGTVDPRVGVSAEDQERLLHALDFWWLYARYAGVPAAPVTAALLVLLVAAAAAAVRLRRAVAREARAP